MGHEFECYYTVAVQDDGSLETALRVKNTGDKDFTFTCVPPPCILHSAPLGLPRHLVLTRTCIDPSPLDARPEALEVMTHRVGLSSTG